MAEAFKGESHLWTGLDCCVVLALGKAEMEDQGHPELHEALPHKQQQKNVILVHYLKRIRFSFLFFFDDRNV